MCREDHPASECGVVAEEVNPIAQAAMIRESEENEDVLGDVKKEIESSITCTPLLKVATMSRGFPIVRMVVYSTGSEGHSSSGIGGFGCSHRNPVMAFGYALMKCTSRSTRESRSTLIIWHAFSPLRIATVPTPEQTYDALAPDLKKKVDAARAARQARENMTTEQLEAQASSQRSLANAFRRNLSPPPAAERPRCTKACVVEFPTAYAIVMLSTRAIRP